MSWSQIALSIFSTVTSFIIWSFLVYIFYVLRNRSLEHKLKQLIQPERSVPDEDRVHIVCANATGVRVTVRDVRLITDDDVHVSLAYIGDTGDAVIGESGEGVGDATLGDVVAGATVADAVVGTVIGDDVVNDPTSQYQLTPDF